MKPRNSLVITKLIERTTTQVGAIFVPAGGESFCEALVIDVPALGASTADLKVGQVVWVQHKRPVKTTQGNALAETYIPYKIGANTFAMFEESQILGIVAENLEEWKKVQSENHQARIADNLLGAKLTN